MSGFDNEILYAENVDFSGDSQVEAKVTEDGQLLIGASSSPNIRVGTLTSGYLTEITNGEGSITIDASEEIVTATVIMGDNRIIRGDGGLRGVQQSLAEITNTGVCNGITQLNVDNLRIDGNQISSTNTNGAINLTPDGSGIVSQTKSAPGVDMAYLVCNQDNTTSTSDALFEALTGGTSSGDAYITMGVQSTRAYALGLDNSDSDKLKIATNNSSVSDPSSGTTLMEINSTGEITKPLQPAFNAYPASVDADVTGDGTVFFLGDTDVGTTLTERFDQNNDFTPGASGGAFFTAPVTGKYQFNFFVLLQQLDGSHVPGLRITTTAENYTYGNFAAPPAGNFAMSFSVLTDMTATDTAKFAVDVGSSTKVVDVFGNASTPRTAISGYLVC